MPRILIKGGVWRNTEVCIEKYGFVNEENRNFKFPKSLNFTFNLCLFAVLFIMSFVLSLLG